MANKKITDEAAMIRYQQVRSQAMWPATSAFLRQVVIKKGITAIELNCGEGDVSFQLARLVGGQGSVLGLDPSWENIRTARQIALIRKASNVTFVQTERYECAAEQHLGLAYGRLPLNPLFVPDETFEAIWKCLQPGGMILLEAMDLSSFHSVPQNYAFERFLDLYHSLLQPLWGDVNLNTLLIRRLSQAGFREVQQQYVPPTFQRGPFKHLASLALAGMQETLLQQNMATPDELQALLHELRSFEQQDHTMINMPGIYQVWGYKK